MNRNGACGYKPGGDVDYNKPSPDGHTWGYDPVEVYTEGDTIEVWWCVMNSADHAGMYSYRLCHDESLVKKFTDKDYSPSLAEKQELEDCFQRGILRCDADGRNDCSKHHNGAGEIYSGVKDDIWSSWFSCDPRNMGNCQGRAERGWTSSNVRNGRALAPSCHNGAGTSLRDLVKLPQGFSSEHTLLSWRWDCQQTKQVWSGCADVKILPKGGTFPPTEPTTAKPTTTRDPASDKCYGLSEKKECGYYGIKEDACVSNGCCWEESNDGSPWCFVSADGPAPTAAPPAGTCAVSYKQECGYYGIKEDGCKANGCCWEESNDGSPWCFHSSSSTNSSVPPSDEAKFGFNAASGMMVAGAILAAAGITMHYRKLESRSTDASFRPLVEEEVDA